MLYSLDMLKAWEVNMKFQRIIPIIAALTLLSGCKGVQKAEKPKFKKYANEVTFEVLNQSYLTFLEEFHFADRSYEAKTDVYREEDTTVTNDARNNTLHLVSAYRRVNNYIYNQEINQLAFVSQVKTDVTEEIKGTATAEETDQKSVGFGLQLKEENGELIAVDKSNKISYSLENTKTTLAEFVSDYSRQPLLNFATVLNQYSYYVIFDDPQKDAFKFYRDNGYLTIVIDYEATEDIDEQVPAPVGTRSYKANQVMQLVIDSDKTFTSAYQGITKVTEEYTEDYYNRYQGDKVSGTETVYATSSYETKKVDVKDIDDSGFTKVKDNGDIGSLLFGSMPY